MNALSQKTAFAEALNRAHDAKIPFVIDGAVGTELAERGMDTSSPLWSGLASLEHGDILRSIHAEYIEAGAQMLTTATFRTTRRAFAKVGLKDDLWRRATLAAVATAKRAAASHERIIIAGSMGPLEDCFLPELAPGGREAASEHALLASALLEAGVDLLWLETFGTLRELESAIQGAMQAGGLHVPYAVSVTTSANGELISGEPLIKALEIAENLGALAFCINCIPVGHVNASIKALEPLPALPLGIYANLGHAEDAQDWRGNAQLSPEEYAVHARYWFERGITIIGGCCGSKPAHIRALKALSSA